ncbi:MAG: PAS domain-containing sensor histidine kinase [Rhizomicrobium sp.]
MSESAYHHNQGEAVEIVLDTGGLVLSICAPEKSRRLIADVAEGESLQPHIHPDDYDFFLWSAQRVLDGNRRQQTIQLRWARAAGRWSKINAMLRCAGDDMVTVEFRPDEIEHARRAVAQLRRVVEGSAQGIVVRTVTEVLYANDSFAHLLGYDSVREMAAEAEAARAEGRDPHLVSLIYVDDRPLIDEHMRRRIAGEETVSSYEFRLNRRDASVVWVEVQAALVNWDGQPASLAWMNDISHRKAMELELVRSKEAAERASRTKTEFLANTSHELRTPLNAIIGFAEVIKDELFGPVGLRKYAEYARDIYTSGRHLLDLINDILDLSKLESGKLELREEDVAAGAMADECVTLLRERADGLKVRLETRIEPGLPLLRCDARALKQVLLNLLSNAIKFTPAGGTVTTAVARAAGGIALSVADTGIGMNPADIEVALSAFGQVDSKVSRQHRGTGLGLPISRSLIEAHGGTLTVSSTPGRGTTMTATFPASRVAAQAA